MISPDAPDDLREAVERMETRLADLFRQPPPPADVVDAVKGATESCGLRFVSGELVDGTVTFTYALPAPTIVRTFRVPD